MELISRVKPSRLKFLEAMEDVAETIVLVTITAAMVMIAPEKIIKEEVPDMRMIETEEEMKAAEMIIAEMITGEMTTDVTIIDVTITDVRNIDATTNTVAMIIVERPAAVDPLELDTKVVAEECKFCN